MTIALLCAVAQGAWAQTWTEVATASELTAAVADGANIRLTSDITLPAYLSVGNGTNQNVTLDLNGHTLKRNIAEAYADGHVIEVFSQGTLTVVDNAGGGTISGGRANNGGGICNYGTLYFQGGTITNCLAAQQGGGIKNNSGATVTMSGGTILGNWGKDGGGIFNAEGGTLNITGGTISGNTSNAGGGGIVNYGTTTISKVDINNNHATTRGGGIWNGGTLDLSGTDFSWPFITNNTCGIDGGGIWQGGTLNLSRVAIVKDNKAVVADGYEPMSNNLCLASGKIINVTDILISSTELYVYCENYEARVITSGYSTNGNKTNHGFFKSDLVGMNNIDYYLYQTDGECALRLRPTDGTIGHLIRYVYRTWDEKSEKVVQSQRLVIAKNLAETYDTNLSGYYYVNVGLTINAKLYASGELHLILCDGASLTANCLLNDEHSIYIYGQLAGTGQFNATDPDSGYPGIGCHGQNGKDIFICGGAITVKGANECAGIGGGYVMDSYSNTTCYYCSNISIYGGTVNARGGGGSAGIGGSCHSSFCGNVYIYGGNVNATGGNSPGTIINYYGVTAAGGAGIGGGDYCYGGGNITIKGGTVIANGGAEAAGIGVGQNSSNSRNGKPNLVQVYISGGTVTATGGSRGAGIGGGDGVSGSTVEISGGTVRAYGGVEAAGIGSGEGADNNNGGELTISGGFVEVWGNEDGAGIGAGEDAALGTVRITGGTLIAHGGSDSNAICTHDDNGTNNLEIGNQMRLRIYDNMLPYNAREWANIQTYHDIQIEPCTHSNVHYTVNGTNTDGKHTAHCSNCTYSKTEKHTFEDGTCTVCHVSGSVSTVSIYLPEEVNESYTDGHYASTPQTQTLVTGTTIKLPDPPVTYLPTGVTFEGWRVGTPEGLGITSYAVGANEQVIKAGTSYTVSADMSLTARYKGIDISLADNADNSAILYDYNGKLAQTVTLAGRTLYRDGAWNTLCLPFSLSSLAGTPLEGATVKTLESATFADGTLTLNFTADLTAIEAGKPYIVKWATTGDDIVSPVFINGLEINNSGPIAVTGDAADFVGNYSPYSTGGEDNTLLYVGADDKLYWPNADMTIGAFRAYFRLNGGLTAGGSSSATVRRTVLNFGDGTTSIDTASPISSPEGKDFGSPLLQKGTGEALYDLSGRKVNSQWTIDNSPLAPGIYIRNGKKIIVK